jgi:phosphoenolpyruvate carboxykinase (diphosphate)
LKCDNRKLVTTYLRVGFDTDGSWRTFGLRKDFNPAMKIQVEDDITASVVVPPAAIGLAGTDSLKFVVNAERRLFQRPDDAIHRGYDKVTEADFARGDNFFSNYEPLPSKVSHDIFEDAIGFHQFTPPMQSLVQSVMANGSNDYFVCTANPRLVDGKPSKNPRYLQIRPDLLNPRGTYLAEMGARLNRRLPLNKPMYNPVAAVLPGRRNNPPEPGIRSLAVYNPIHYFELPELFMEFICSMTGKSPSTTGAGSEGALTKGPFNALPPVIDLNNALVAYILTGHHAFVTAAGYVGPKFRVDHDVSLLVPEVWCRMTPEERNPQFLIAERCLEKCRDFEQDKKTVLAGRLGYRINARFVRRFFGRVFNHPTSVCTEEMLRPELQDMDIFVDGMDNIVTTQKRVAKMYFDDGGVAQACPPLKALLHIMLYDQWEGRGLDHPEFRKLFTRESLLASDWYAARLAAKQKIDRNLWRRHVDYLEKFLKRSSHADEAERLGIANRLAQAKKTAEQVESPAYRETLRGTIGAEPIEAYLNKE